jgi:predicted transcriptional regulator
MIFRRIKNKNGDVMLTLKQIISELDLKTYCGEDFTIRPVSGGYCGDLMSDVLANAEAGRLWITVQMHSNIAAVASLKELCGVIIANGKQPAPETIQKAEGEKIPILGSSLSSFELAAKISALLAAGANDAAKNPS